MKLVVFDVDSLRGLRGLDRYTALERYRRWRGRERLNDRRLLKNLKKRLYFFRNPDKKKDRNERKYLVHRKVKILDWFIFQKRYIDGEGDVMIDINKTKELVLTVLEGDQKKDRFVIAVETNSSLSRTYNALKVLEAEGVVKCERVGRQILWQKVV